MKFISWNVNGLRAAINKGLEDFIKTQDADFICIQETKMQEEQITSEILKVFNGYKLFFNSAEKKGYSGTLICAKTEPINVTYGIGIDEHDKEGRVITLEYEDFYLVNCYTPNSKRELERLDYRQIWEDEIRNYLIKLDRKKPVIYCGDLNVAHKEIDLKNPNTNHKSAGFTDEEREKFSRLIDSGFVDTFRYFYPNQAGAYTWWSYMFNARQKDIGWRIDYFLVSKRIADKLKEAKIYKDILGSDHCPISISL